MRLQSEQLQQLRGRWQKPLLAAAGGASVEVGGCRTFAELLQLRLGEIGRLADSGKTRSADGGNLDEWRAEMRKTWEQQADTLFAEMVDELRAHGLEEVTAIETARYEIREPYDLRGASLRAVDFCGAYLENARFEGADLTRANFAGARCFETHFEDACCEHVSFAGAECHFAVFTSAVCDHASFERADCTMARFDRARLLCASFDGAVCFAASFNGAFLAKAAVSEMRINHLTRFGRSGEQQEAELARPPRARKKDEGDDWYIVELFPVWLRAAEVNARIRSLLRNNGYFWEADEYQYLEMVCRRHVLHQNPLNEFFEWFFKDLMFGYGLKWKRPLISVMMIILLWAFGFALHFHLNALHGLFTSIGYGLYYSVISFTTLGFGSAPDLDGVWPKILLCSEALLGTILMPLFLLAYARKILQD